MSDHVTQGAALEGVAIIGMAGRFPGARSVAEFWRNQLEGNISLFQQLDLIEMINDMILADAFKPEFLAQFDVKAPIRIPRSFETEPAKPYHIPCIEMPLHLQDRLDYEGKIDRSAANIDWLLENGEAAAKAFLVERDAAVCGTAKGRAARA